MGCSASQPRTLKPVPTTPALWPPGAEEKRKRAGVLGVHSCVAQWSGLCGRWPCRCQHAGSRSCCQDADGGLGGGPGGRGSPPRVCCSAQSDCSPCPSAHGALCPRAQAPLLSGPRGELGQVLGPETRGRRGSCRSVGAGRVGRGPAVPAGLLHAGKAPCRGLRAKLQGTRVTRTGCAALRRPPAPTSSPPLSAGPRLFSQEPVLAAQSRGGLCRNHVSRG